MSYVAHLRIFFMAEGLLGWMATAVTELRWYWTLYKLTVCRLLYAHIPVFYCHTSKYTCSVNNTRSVVLRTCSCTCVRLAELALLGVCSRVLGHCWSGWNDCHRRSCCGAAQLDVGSTHRECCSTVCGDSMQGRISTRADNDIGAWREQLLLLIIWYSYSNI